MKLLEVVTLHPQLHHVFVRVVELPELFGRVVGDVEGPRPIEHVVTEQLIEAVETLGRLRLVQQLQCAVVRDTEDLAHPGVERAMRAGSRDQRIRPLRLDLARLEPLGGEGLELAEIQRRPFDHEYAREIGGLGARALGKEEANQRRGVVDAVVVPQQNPTPGGTLPEVLAHHAVFVLVAGPVPCATNVAHQISAVVACRRALRGGVEP
ncbi:MULTISPECIES: hypothetical protein [Gulosibacter]|uniref:hypothetical protein n=1 Tax=Gulosibacter TaxID=256818 RepID=UPI001F3DC9F2|nr:MULTISPECIES: hypothetical protein [Gulosibacter]